MKKQSQLPVGRDMKYVLLALFVCACTSTTSPDPALIITGDYRVYLDDGIGPAVGTWKASVEKGTYMYTAHSAQGEDSVFGGYPWQISFVGKDTIIAQTTGNRSYLREDFEWISGGYTFEQWSGTTDQDEQYMTHYKFRFVRLN